MSITLKEFKPTKYPNLHKSIKAHEKHGYKYLLWAKIDGRLHKKMAAALGTGVNNDPLAALDPNRTIIVSKTNKYVKVMFRDPMMFASDSATLQSSAKTDEGKEISKMNALKIDPHLYILMKEMNSIVKQQKVIFNTILSR